MEDFQIIGESPTPKNPEIILTLDELETLKIEIEFSGSIDLKETSLALVNILINLIKSKRGNKS